MVAPLDIQEMQHVARQRGGECLSRHYINNTTKLKWLCEKNHEWMAQPAGVLLGSWCPECSKSKKLTIEEMQKMAKVKGGKCLSKTYVNVCTPLKWKCALGHIWKTAPKNIRKGHWCHVCAGRAKITIKDMREIAKKRGGKCCSKKYLGTRSKLEWQCEEGHTWKATPSMINQDRWCHVCGGTQKKTIEEMHPIAKERGGKCLSEVYTNQITKLTWECEKGHIWEAPYKDIKQGNWCAKCAHIRNYKNLFAKKES